MVVRDGELEALRMLADRRDKLAHHRVRTVNRLQRLLGELLPGQRTRDLDIRSAWTSPLCRQPPPWSALWAASRS